MAGRSLLGACQKISAVSWSGSTAAGGTLLMFAAALTASWQGGGTAGIRCCAPEGPKVASSAFPAASDGLAPVWQRVPAGARPGSADSRRGGCRSARTLIRRQYRGGTASVSPAIPRTGTGSGGETAENWEWILVSGERSPAEAFSVPELTRKVAGASKAEPISPPADDGRSPGAGDESRICSAYRSWDKREVSEEGLLLGLDRGYPQAEAKEGGVLGGMAR